MNDPWHCAQIPNQNEPIVVCQRETLLARIAKLQGDLAEAEGVLQSIVDENWHAEATALADAFLTAGPDE